MKTLRLFSIFAAGAALALSACSKSDDPMGDSTSSTTVSDEGDSTTGGDFGDESADTTADTTADTGDTADSSTSATDSGFVPDEDFGNVSSCDPWTQDCPDGEKCVAYASAGGSWDANKCVPVTGSGATGDPCMYGGAVESTDDCDENNWCWDVDMEGIGTCTPFCTGSPDDPQCEPGTSCSIANEGSINLCLLSCNPLLQDCPVDGTSCFWDGGGFVCANATQDIPVGEPCGYINDCVGGTICLAPDVFPSCNGASCCGEFCDLADPTCTLAGTECTAFFEEGQEIPGLEDVGVCIVPGS